MSLRVYICVSGCLCMLEGAFVMGVYVWSQGANTVSPKVHMWSGHLDLFLLEGFRRQGFKIYTLRVPILSSHIGTLEGSKMNPFFSVCSLLWSIEYVDGHN